MASSIYLARDDKYDGLYRILFGERKNSLECTDRAASIAFLPDTKPKAAQLSRPKSYYGDSPHGTDWPDRWLFTSEERN